MPKAPQIKLAQAATPEEAAAIAAAVQRFTADTAIALPAEPAGRDPWLEAALAEGVSSALSFGLQDPLGT